MLGCGVAQAPPAARRLIALATLVAALACVLVFAGRSDGSVKGLQAKAADARAQAEGLAADLAASKSEMFAAQEEAAAAASRERELTSLLATGRERAARIGDRLEDAERRLAGEQARLGRARGALADRLVAIYRAGDADLAEVAVGGGSFNDIAVRSGYVTAIQDADDALATRVEAIRDEVSETVEQTTGLRDRARAYNARLESAQGQIVSVRAAAESEAANLSAVSAERSTQIAGLQETIDGLTSDIADAKAAAAERAAATAAEEAAAEEEVETYFGGPYSIPTYIVMCESGGNYSALNPSSGAGGAYQILPSTWAAYGGEGLPHEASKEEQDRIAALIYADSGTAPWVCG